MKIDVLLGLQWGDEGKGKIVDHLAPNYQVVARFQGGPNAGHTLKFENKKFVLHTIPSGIFRENSINLIGNGVVIDPITLVAEMQVLRAASVDFEDRLLLSRKAHLILPTHRFLDAASEASKGKEKIGSTLKGIGPTYMDKTGRNGLRIGDIFSSDFIARYENLKAKHLQLVQMFPEVGFDLATEETKWLNAIEEIRKLKVVDGEFFIDTCLREGKSILAEGAQGSMLDIEYGTYPYVTSSSTITAGVCTGLGVSPQKIGEVIGITKAYCTRVGSGPFPTELFDHTGAFLQKEGAEFGATTGRPRRCGWIDLVALRYTMMLSGVTQLAITKVDVLNKLDTIRVCNSYESAGKKLENFPYEFSKDIQPVYDDIQGWNADLEACTTYDALPEALKNYVTYLEKQLGVRTSMISTGPERHKLIEK